MCKHIHTENCPVMKRCLSHTHQRDVSLFHGLVMQHEGQSYGIELELLGKTEKIIKLQPPQSGKVQLYESMWGIRVKSSNHSSGVARWQRIREGRLSSLSEKSTSAFFGLPVGLTWLLTPYRSWQEFSFTFYYIMLAWEDAKKKINKVSEHRWKNVR